MSKTFIIENYEPLEPLNITVSKLKHDSVHVCGCNNSEVREVREVLKDCGCATYTPSVSFAESADMPIVQFVVAPDEIKTAQDAISAAFAGFRPASSEAECSKTDKILKALELDTPKNELKSASEIKDVVIAKVTEKILAKMKGRVAIIKEKDSQLSCLNKDDKIEYLVVEGKPGESEEPKPAEDPKPANPTNPASPVIPDDLPEDARDGIIEDLVGVIEVSPKPNR